MRPPDRRQQCGADEFRFAEEDRAITEALAASLLRLRQLGQQLTGHPGPDSVRAIVTGAPLRARDVWRPTWFLSLGLVIVTLLLWWTVIIPLIYWGLALFVLHRARKTWPRAGGLCVGGSSAWLPVLAVRWPELPRDRRLTRLRVHLDARAEAEAALAHEYAHSLLRAIRRTVRIPKWFSEGFAEVFADYACGYRLWMDESRDCVGEPERRSRRVDAAFRLRARYYWEVRTLAEQGTLWPALTAPRRKLARLRPVLHAERPADEPPEKTWTAADLADVTKMARLTSGPDEILCESGREKEAEAVAAMLPELRRRGQGITGKEGPRALCVTVSAYPPPVAFVRRVVRGRTMLGTSRGSRVGRLLPARWQNAIWVWVLARDWPQLATLGLWGSENSLLMVHVPRPPALPGAAEFVYEVPEEAALRRVLAFTYARCLLPLRGRQEEFPRWFLGGFADWFGEGFCGQPYWRPETQRWVREPEPPYADLIARNPDFESFLPLRARSYWLVRSLVEQGKLPEALTASRAELAKLAAASVAPAVRP
jgi:hypothetical protein